MRKALERTFGFKFECHINTRMDYQSFNNAQNVIFAEILAESETKSRLGVLDERVSLCTLPEIVSILIGIQSTASKDWRATSCRKCRLA